MFDSSKKKKNEKPSSISCWEENGIDYEDIIMQRLQTYQNLTKETKLIALQLKIIHNIVATKKNMIGK